MPLGLHNIWYAKYCTIQIVIPFIFAHYVPGKWWCIRMLHRPSQSQSRWHELSVIILRLLWKLLWLYRWTGIICRVNGSCCFKDKFTVALMLNLQIFKGVLANVAKDTRRRPYLKGRKIQTKSLKYFAGYRLPLVRVRVLILCIPT